MHDVLTFLDHCAPETKHIVLGYMMREEDERKSLSTLSTWYHVVYRTCHLPDWGFSSELPVLRKQHKCMFTIWLEDKKKLRLYTQSFRCLNIQLLNTPKTKIVRSENPLKKQQFMWANRWAMSAYPWQSCWRWLHSAWKSPPPLIFLYSWCPFRRTRSSRSPPGQRRWRRCLCSLFLPREGSAARMTAPPGPRH